MFVNREDAGKKLAEKCRKYAADSIAVVVGLPRGEVVLVYCIAKELHLSLEILIACKLRAPHNSELVIGAVTIFRSISK